MKAIDWILIRAFLLAVCILPCANAMGATLDMVAGVATDSYGNHLIWTPGQVFWTFNTPPTPAYEIKTTTEKPIAGVQGILSDVSNHLIWTPTNVFYTFGDDLSATEVKTELGDQVGSVQGIVSDQLNNHLIWTPTKLLFTPDTGTTAYEIKTPAGASIGNIQSIACDRSGYDLIWTPGQVFYASNGETTAHEIKAGGSSINNVQNIVSDPSGNHLIWTRSQLFHTFGADATASEIFFPPGSGVSIAGIQGIVSDGDSRHFIWTASQVLQSLGGAEPSEIKYGGLSIPGVQGIVVARDQVYNALIWTSSQVFVVSGANLTADPILAPTGGAIPGVEGVVSDGRGHHFMWTATQVFLHFNAAVQVSEILTSTGDQVKGVRGIVSDHAGYNDIWTANQAYYTFDTEETAHELLSSTGASLRGVEGIVSDRDGYHVVWTSTQVFSQFLSEEAFEIKTVVGSKSIFSYDPTKVTMVQVATHRAGRIDAASDQVIGLSGAGLVGTPTWASAAYPGLSSGAVVVPAVVSPSPHSTIIGVSLGATAMAESEYGDRTALVLGPGAISGVVSGNSMVVFARSSGASTSIPTVSVWGVVLMGLSLLAAGSILLRRVGTA